MSFFVDHFVTVRVARMTFGNEVHEVFYGADEEHRKRSWNIVTDANGANYLRHGDQWYLIRLDKARSTYTFATISGQPDET